MKVSKTALRAHWKQQRLNVSSQRRSEAQQQGEATLLSLAQTALLVLSYASIGTEFETWSINHFLAEQGKLVLPKVVGTQLKLYHVKNIQHDLIKGSLGILEPHFNCQELTEIEKISLALIPGLAFDAAGYRLGYGKGFYDKLLPLLSQTKLVGLGLKEQLSPIPLKFDSWDYPVHTIYLF